MCPLQGISHALGVLLTLDCEGNCVFSSPSAMHQLGQRGQVPEEGADMTGDDVREIFEALLPQEAIDRRCMDGDVIARPRKMTLGMWVRAMVIAAGTPGGAYQADILRSSLEVEVPQVARSACSRWFDEPLERFMAALAERALAYARAQPVDLSGPLGGVKDWDSVESTTVRVHSALHGEFPGTGE
jgi:hypothetical protein